MIIAHVLSNAA